jgi:hypothetical protein
VKLEDVFVARIQAQFTSSHRNDSGVATTSNQLTLTEVTLYPISVSFGASGVTPAARDARHRPASR